jgi:tetratricopeptide (TPR) repeat protein
MRRRVLLVLFIAVALGLGAWAGWRLHHRHAVVAAHLPPVPALSSSPTALADSIAEAEAQARHWREAPQGIAALASLYHANGFYAEALTCYQGLRLVDPRNARWPHLVANIAANYGRMDEAVPLLQRAVELAPDYIPARLQLGEALLKSNQTSAAAAAYAEALRRAPGDPHVLLGLARCDVAVADLTKARERLREAVTSHPDFVGGLSFLATVSEQLGDSSTASALRQNIGRRQFAEAPDPWVDKLFDVCFDPYRLSVAAAIASSAGDRARGLELAERAIALAPRISSHRRNAAQIMLADGNPAGARHHLEEAVNFNPLDSDAWLLLVGALRTLGEEQAAQVALQKGLIHCPKSGSLRLARAQAWAAAERVPEAIAEFRLSAALNPNDAAPLVEMADLCFATGQGEAGLQALRHALQRQPGNPLALTSLTFYFIVTGDERSALSHWEEVRNQPRTPPFLLERLRQAYRGQFGRDLP